uniref:Ground-like domain-containing protein n=1 Tax=Globodera pallida TaxID=36090 RepID=A0A183C2N8_GLOPA
MIDGRRAVHTEHAHSSQQQNLLNSSLPTRPRHKMLFSKPCSVFASHPLMVLLPMLFIVVAMLSSNSVSAIGMPQKMECCQPAMMSCCAAPAMQSCGCGRRKKREAVQPHIKGNETPCPQTEWRQLMQNAIVPLDDIESVNSVQKALMRRFPDNKFLVMCALAGDEIKRPAADSKQMLPNETPITDMAPRRTRTPLDFPNRDLDPSDNHL